MRARGIPTTYRSVRFRSRLEARYACLFDLCGIEWAYEPHDTRAYIPDFLIGRRLLAEVKPIDWDNCYDDTPIVEARERLEHAFPDRRYPLALLGATIDAARLHAVIGETSAIGSEWAPLRLEWRFDIKTGEHLAHLGECVRGSAPLRLQRLGGDFQRLWRTAASRVQWKGRRAA